MIETREPHPLANAPAARTIAAPVSIEGTGIHSGAPCRVRLQPRPAGHGIVFQRPGGTSVPATFETANAEASDRRTVIIGPDGTRFEQIEHLMAALYAMGISDVLVEQEGPEVPFLDGGSLCYMERLREMGTSDCNARRPVLRVTRPVDFEVDGACFTATPHDGLRLSVFVEFPGTVVGSAGFTLEITEGSFLRQAAPARTFALAADIEKLRAAGLARGGDLRNAVVFDHERYYNESLNFPDEVVRHKIIDLLGDLALLPCCLMGHFWGWRTGHRSHVLFAQFLAREFTTIT